MDAGNQERDVPQKVDDKMSKKKQAKTPTQGVTRAAEPIVEAIEPEGPTPYAVPSEVAIALNTGRSQFINGLVSKIRRGHVVDPVQVIGMLELIRDWTDAKYADDRRNAIVRESLAASMTHLQEFRAQLSELVGRIGESVTEAHHVSIQHGSGPLAPKDALE